MVLSVNGGKLTARMLARVLQMAARKIQQEHKNHQTPHGRQTVGQLMAHGAATSSIEVDAPRQFDRVARRWNVDYAFYKTGPNKYLLFFKSGQADAITACFSEYSRRVLNKSHTRRRPVMEQLKQSGERARQQPQRAREREAAHEDR